MKCVVCLSPECQVINETDGFDLYCHAVVVNGSNVVADFSTQARVTFASSSTQMGNAVKDRIVAEALRVFGVTISTNDVRVIGGII